jgi:dienelactone hydrolase
MPDPADPTRFDEFVLAQAKALRAEDRPPGAKAEWERSKPDLRKAMLAAMGPMPDMPAPLNAQVLGKLARDGFHIERLIFQTRPNVWVTANMYVPAGAKKSPAVLVVHGHWAGARRDPVVQARCLGLVKLGFVVLAVDAFGSGERYTIPARGTYHGALYGSTLWPTGHTLLGMQVYDNRRTVDYLLTRDEVDGNKLGVTGASGGGNQTMYAGALDERFGCVVPVCSVGQYQAYLKAACCVCEVLPGALKFTEEGDVLGLVAPRALMVINASRDAFQFSPGEAAKSIERAERIFRLYGAGERVKHVVFDSGHDYSKPMREAMYGWMTRWLKGTGDGSPIAEPKHEVEPPEALACFPNPDKRPKDWLYLPTFAARAGRELTATHDKLAPRHAEEWESTATQLRGQLRKLLGEMPKPPRPAVKPGGQPTNDDPAIVPLRLNGEEGMPIPMLTLSRRTPPERRPACVVLHLDGKAAALKHPLPRSLASAGWLVAIPDLRATGDLKPPSDAIGKAVDHNSTEHALWIGRPLLGQWAFDVQCVLEWLAIQANREPNRTAVIGIGQAGLVALAAAALFPERVTSVGAVDSPLSLVTERAYPEGTHMGVLVPGLLTAGDVPHLAALSAPRRLVVVGGTGPTGELATGRVIQDAFAFTRKVYDAHRHADRLTLTQSLRWEELASAL